MATHERCEWNCGGTACDAPKRPPIKDGPARNLAHHAGTYGGYKPTPKQTHIDPWLAAAVTLYAANIIGWFVLALWRALGAQHRSYAARRKGRTMTTNTDGVSAMSAELKCRDPERKAFEAWLNPGNHTGNVSPWVEPGRYEKETHQLAWLAWQAARPKRAAIGSLINLAADCALRKPLRSLAPLTEATHIGHRQFGRAYKQADDSLAVLSQDLRAAIDAL